MKSGALVSPPNLYPPWVAQFQIVDFDSLTDFHFISVQNWWNFDRKLECKHGKYKTVFCVRNAGYREFRETGGLQARGEVGEKGKNKQTKTTTTTATKTGRNSENPRAKRAERWTGWLHSPIVFFSSPLPNFFSPNFSPQCRACPRLPRPSLVRCCAVLTPR